MAEFLYATYPTAKVFAQPGDKRNIHELLWGDWVRLKGAKSQGWFPVRVRGVDGFMRAEDLTEERLLEVVFVDVGQGDGCLVVTPKDKHMVVDAGERDNMFRFLRWRYGGFKKKWKFESAVISHPDQDHYRGFQKLFEEPNVSFGTVYHNGIIEARSNDHKKVLGEIETVDGIRYLTELMETRSRLKAFLQQGHRWRGSKPQHDKRYPKLLSTADTSGRVDAITMLSTAHSEEGFLPGYGADQELSIEVLGPVVETDDGQRSLLRWFKRFGKGGFDKGQTKNGHSVLLKLRYRNVSLLLSGDLNWAAERFLLEQHLGREVPGPDAEPDEHRAFVALAREIFSCDVAKSCHHGSADFMNVFLEATDPAATVVSSGDQESHAHPRSDTLGAIGRFGRGDRPLIFSTELARSAREAEPIELQQKLVKLQDDLAEETDPDKKDVIRAKLKEVTEKILERNVTVFGAINLRTDGHKVLMAQKLERDRSSGSSLKKWDVYRLEPNADGKLELAESGGH